MPYSNQKGNVVLWVVLMVLIAAIFGVGGWYLGRSIAEKAASEKAAESEAAATRPVDSGPATASRDNEITSPDDGDVVSSPLTITGRAVAFENTVTVRLLDENGKVLAEESIQTDAKDVGQSGNFSATLSFETPATDTGTVEVFEQSAATGEPIGKVSVKVRFK